MANRQVNPRVAHFNRIFCRAIELSPRYAIAFYNPGAISYTPKNYITAIADFIKAIASVSSMGAAWYNRALDRYRVNDYENAITDLSQTLELNSGNANIYKYMRMTYSALEISTNALQDYTTAISLNRSDYTLYHLSGTIKMKMNNTQERSKDLLKAGELGCSAPNENQVIQKSNKSS